MFERRRSLRNDAAYMLAVLYTSGFLGVVFVVILKDVPKESAPIVQQLISIMSMIQAAIAGYFYGASKAANESNQTVSRIAEAAAPAQVLAVAAARAPAHTEPVVPAAPDAVTPAPKNPETGNVPAAEVHAPTPADNPPKQDGQ